MVVLAPRVGPSRRRHRRLARGRPAWARALGLALAAGLLAGAALLWRNGLQVDPRGAARTAPAALGPGAYGAALGWVGLYALAAGAVWTWLARAVLGRAA